MRHLTGLFCMMARLTLEEAKIKSVCLYVDEMLVYFNAAFKFGRFPVNVAAGSQ